ncbi:hypothetical protein Taro_019296 [Colocasia esculenta]|uniref:BHLH domain-containing protein n=1 Tax=Colocasia esculenta TaxID=4460 RepID=A0A843V1T4_COLES|nr:hypothetical protein [Colocasia esculenta]
MGSGGNNSGWFLDFGGMEEEVHATEFIWPSHFMDDPTVSSTLGLDLARKEDNNCENATKKRNRVTSCAGPGTKACREKMRRDRLNDRFVELCSILDPGRPPKADKVVILIDAAHRLSQLRLEAQKLTESNQSLQETIKSLKNDFSVECLEQQCRMSIEYLSLTVLLVMQAEKSELRDEKVRLKAEKDHLEQMLRGMSVRSPFVAQPVAASFHPAAYATCNKNIPRTSYPPVGMWQWIPPASLDTSQDHCSLSGHMASDKSSQSTRKRRRKTSSKRIGLGTSFVTFAMIM